ncbi:uncharacterized protein LOC114292993 [Camellia sinensis]|uniref:uncharacterized protein LOC114292993 n=1 Tax=Camellia sinensis TaxID=4442 RepID=UPI001036D8BB|nr:uncharacterized protein LOC114292993 [Camellia sinensis]
MGCGRAERAMENGFANNSNKRFNTTKLTRPEHSSGAVSTSASAQSTLQQQLQKQATVAKINSMSSIPSNLSLLISNLSSFITVKLDASNFLIWKNQTQNILKATDLLGIVDGTSPCPSVIIKDDSESNVDNLVYFQWKLEDAHLFSCITATLSPAIYSTMLHLHSYSEVWSALHKRFTALSRSHMHQLKNKLNSVTKKTDSIKAYLTNIKELISQLAFASTFINDEDLVLLILNGLHGEYDAFKTTIRARSESISMDELSSLLLSNAIHVVSKHHKDHTEPIVAFSYVRGFSNYTYQSSGSRGRYSRGGQGASSSSVPWYLDSTAIEHITPELNNLSSSHPYHGSDQITIGDGNTVPIHHTGKGLLPTPHFSFWLNNVLHTPSISSNLVSVHRLAKDNNCSITFDDSTFVVQDKVSKKILHQGSNINGLYHFHPSLSTAAISLPMLHAHLSSSHTVVPVSTSVWHNRLGHPSVIKLHHLMPYLSVSKSDHKSTTSDCTDCCVAKRHKLPFYLSNSTVNAPFSLIHSDVWGPYASSFGYKYYVLFVDDFSRFTWLYPLAYKSEVCAKFMEFKAYVEIQFATTLHILQTDKGSECFTSKMKTYLTTH